MHYSKNKSEFLIPGGKFLKLEKGKIVSAYKKPNGKVVVEVKDKEEK